MSVPTFIVGTGRCGSTMLSNMVREHPKVLSLSEFFGYVQEGQFDRAFASDPVNGETFWEIVAFISPLARFCSRHRIVIPEGLYDRDAPAARYSWETGVPALLMTTLPHLTDDHDHLFERLGAEVGGWSDAPLAAHYLRLFAWLAAHFGKPLWVERSGTSLLWTEHLLRMFPDARFIHVVRDGRDAALSMRAHNGLRIVVGLNTLREQLGEEPTASSVGRDAAPTDLQSLLPDGFDAATLRNFDVPLTMCGGFWEQQVRSGLAATRRLSSDRLLTLRYEDFFGDAKAQLDRFAAFLGDGFVDDDWSAACAAAVRQPRSTWRDLAEADARALTEACRPGFELLREAGVYYDV